jgi:hypothetical protein
MDQTEITIAKLFSVLEDAMELIEHLLVAHQEGGPMSDAGYQRAMGQIGRIQQRIARIKADLGIENSRKS